MLKNYFVRFLNITLFISVVLFLSLVTSACSGPDSTAALANSSEEPTMMLLNPHTFAMNIHGQSLLRLSGDVCQVHVQSGDNSHVVVQVAVRHYRKNSMPAISYKRSGAGSVLSINEKLPLQISPNAPTDSVAINVTVPSRTNLLLSTRVGDLTVSNVSGQLALATATGNITVADSQLSRQSSLTTDVGNIFFAGAFMPRGSYRMEARVGRLDLALQGSPALQIDAQTTIGTISSDFPSLKVDGNMAQGVLGTPPYTHLSLTTRVGSISLFCSVKGGCKPQGF